MTDSLTPGGAGMPDEPARLPDPAAPEEPTASQPAEPGAGTPTPDATSPWASPATEPEPLVASTPLEGSAGFGMPLGMDAAPPTAPAAPDVPNAPAAPPEPGAPADWGGAPAGWAPGSAPTAAMGGAAAITPKKRALPIGLFVVIGVAIVIISAVVYFTKDQKRASDLTVGDCFDVPTANVDINTVKSDPCDQSHTGETFFITTYPDAATYPADSDFETFAENNCNPVYATYVGATLDQTTDYTIGFFYPQSDGWANGDRTVMCYATRQDGAPTSKSVKGSGGTP